MQEKQIIKNNKNQNLVGVLYKPNKKEFPVAIFCHGYRSDKNSSKVPALAKELVSKGIALFAFDFAGSGESDGKFEDTTLTQQTSDLKAVIDYFSNLNKEIAVIGSSLGGISALNQAAKNSKIKVLVLMSPVSSFPTRKTGEYSEEGVRQWKESGYTYTYSERKGKLKINYSFYKDGVQYSNYEIYKKIKIPTLIIHGTKDESINIKDSIKLNKTIKASKLIVLKDADHIYTRKGDFDRVMKEIADFIEEHL